MRGLALRSSHILQPRQRGPIIDIDLTADALDPRIVFTRASGKTYFDANGVMQTAAANVWPVEYDPVTHAPLGRSVWLQSTNQVRNPRAQGGSSSATPGFWNAAVVSSVTGLTLTPVGMITINGIPGMRYRLTGTSSGSGNTLVQFRFETPNIIAAAANQTWTQSVYAAYSGGSLSGITGFTQYIFEYDSNPSFVGNIQGTFRTPSQILTRLVDTGTVQAPAATSIAPYLALGVTAGIAVDITLDICGPQLEQRSAATPLILPPEGSPNASTRAGDIATISLLNPPASFSLAAEGVPGAAGVLSGLLAADGGTLSQTNMLRKSGSDTAQAVSANNTEGSNGGSLGGNWAAGARGKIAGSFAVGNVQLGFNGTVSPPFAAAALGVVSEISIGALAAGNYPWNGTIKRARMWGRTMGTAELQAITS